MEAKVRNGNLVITLPIEKARPSASGKNVLIASSHGARLTTARMNGKIISAVVSAFVPNDEPVNTKDSKKKRKGRG
jgi:hypothetical protein